jgi:hypothetical protein
MLRGKCARIAADQRRMFAEKTENSPQDCEVEKPTCPSLLKRPPPSAIEVSGKTQADCKDYLKAQLVAPT